MVTAVRWLNIHIGRYGRYLSQVDKRAAGGELIRVTAHAPCSREGAPASSLLVLGGAPASGEAAGPLPVGGIAGPLLAVRQLGQVLPHRQQRVLLPEIHQIGIGHAVGNNCFFYSIGTDLIRYFSNSFT